MSGEETLRAFLARVDAALPRVVVRHADEARITANQEDSGYAVRRVTYLTLTARVDGAAAQQRVEGVSLRRARDIIEEYPVLVLYRSDHIT